MDMKECYEKIGGDYEAVFQRLRQDERIRKFLMLFPKDTNFQLLKDSLEAKDWDSAFRAAHSLKGVSLNLGLAALAKSASDMTEALRGGAPAEDPAPLFERVREDCERVLNGIAELNAAE